MTRPRPWIIVAAWIAALGALAVLAVPRTHFATSVLDLLPDGDTEVAILKTLAETGQGRLLTLRLHSSGAAPVAAPAVLACVAALRREASIEAAWLAGDEAFRDAARVLFEQRHALLLPQWLQRQFPDAPTAAPADAATIAARVVDELDRYLQSPASFALAELIPNDPLLLLGALAEAPLPLPGSDDNRQAILWVRQRPSPFLAAGQQPVFAALERALDAARQIQPGLQLEYSGVAVFAAASKAAIKGEIGRINLLCVLLVLLVALYAVRDLGRMARICAVLALAMLTAVVGVIAIFPAVHILALVIGSILAGIAVDYGFHLILVEADGLPRRTITKAVIAGSLSSALGFVTLLGAPMPFLRQVGAFVGIGLIAALLAALALRPAEASGGRLHGWKPYPFSLPRWTGVLLLILAAAAARPIIWSDNIGELEYPLPEIRARDARLRALAGDSGQQQPLLVLGADIIAARDRLARIVAQPDAAGHIHAGRWVPTFAEAAAAHARFAQMPAFAPALRRELAARDYLEEAFEPFFTDWETYLATPMTRDHYVQIVARLAGALPGPVSHMLHVGDGLAWFVLLAPPGSAPAATDHILALDQNRMLSRAFAHYRESMLAYAGFCLLALAFGILLAYGRAGGMQALLLPAAAVAIAGALAGALQVGTGLFHVVGAFLAFCIGLDYALFAVIAHRERARMPVSISISCLTTAGVFGILASSQIPAVRALGLSVLAILALTVLLLLCGWPRQRRPARRTHFNTLPHGEEALLIDGIRSLQDNTIEVALRPQAHLAAPGEHLLDALAQAAAVLVAHQATGEKVRRPGMLVLVEACHLPGGPARRLDQGCVARVEAHSRPRPGLLKFNGQCLDGDGRELLRAAFAIYIP